MDILILSFLPVSLRPFPPPASSILRLFVYLSFFRSRNGPLNASERYDRGYWRSTRESSDSFRRVRNNLLNYRMPKVTRTRRETDEKAGRRGGGREGEGTVDVMVQIGRMSDSPGDRDISWNLAAHTPAVLCTLTLTKLARTRARARKSARANTVYKTREEFRGFSISRMMRARRGRASG